MSTKKLQILDSLVLQAENANTLEGKTASEFASASDVEQLQALVGDEPVADQISVAVQESAIVIDTTLTQSGQAADAKVTGDELALCEVTSNKAYSKDDITESNKENLYPSLPYMEKYYYDYDEINNIFMSATTNSYGDLAFIIPNKSENPNLGGAQMIVTDCNVKYTLTEDDKNEIATAVKTDCTQIEPNFANDISECVDTSKVYVLPDGYVYAYMKTTTEGTSTPNFTNLMDDPNSYIKEGYRYSHSGQAFQACDTDTAIVVPITQSDKYIIRVKGATQSGCVYATAAYFGTTNTTFEGTPTNEVTGDFVLGEDSSVDISLIINKPPSGTYNYLVFHVAPNVTTESLIVTVNEEITYTTTEGGVTYEWLNTGHAFVQANYEDRILANEQSISELKTDVEILEESLGSTPAELADVSVFSTPAYAPTPQLPADGSEGSDFNESTMSTQDAYDYMDLLCNKYNNYIHKQTMGKDASDTFDHNRYILSKAYWRAWQKENYPKMFAWINGDAVIYSTSVSPRVDDNMYSTSYIETVYGTVTSVNCEVGVLSTRTVNNLVFERYPEGDIEPSLIYTKVPLYPKSAADWSLYNSSFSSIGKVTEYGEDFIKDADGVKYFRYPFEDLKADKTKPLSIFILANEHGYHGDAMIPSFVVMRMAKDLCKNTENQFLKWLKENVMITMIPVGNPWGYERHLTDNGSGYYNSNGININRNYDTPGWSTSDTNYGDVETFGDYPGCEIETQHIMNTMQMCKPAVGISMHGLELPDQYKDQSDNGYFIHQGCGYDSTRIDNIAETLYSSYNLAASGDTVAAHHYNSCGKSPAYIQYVGAVGGLTETICWEAGTNNTYTSTAMEQAYSQLLMFLQTWCEEALEKED